MTPASCAGVHDVASTSAPDCAIPHSSNRWWLIRHSVIGNAINRNAISHNSVIRKFVIPAKAGIQRRSRT
jgi:hypothetical protein